MTRHEFIERGCWLIMAAFCMAVILSMTGCATPAPATPKRFLTEAQEEEMKVKCETGCVVVPVPMWQEILKALSGNRV
jgi:hypothetical protein